jgi:hypothetical protein
MCKKGESGRSQKMGGTVEGIESMRRRIQKVSRKLRGKEEAGKMRMEMKDERNRRNRVIIENGDWDKIEV